MAMPPLSEAARTMARLDVEMQEYFVRDEGDSDAAGAIRDRMADVWYSMSQDEQELMRGLSADLNSLRRGGLKFVQMTAEEFPTYREAVRRVLAPSVAEPDIALQLTVLRGSHPFYENVQPASVRYLQAMSWLRMNLPTVALSFMRDAISYDSRFLARKLLILRELDLGKEESDTAKQLVIDKPLDPYAVGGAADTLWSLWMQSPETMQDELNRIASIIISAYRAIVWTNGYSADNSHAVHKSWENAERQLVDLCGIVSSPDFALTVSQENGNLSEQSSIAVSTLDVSIFDSPIKMLAAA